MKISNETREYNISDHASIRSFERDIPTQKIYKTIDSGEAKQTPKQTRILYTKQFDDDNEPVEVVVNRIEKEVITVMWESGEDNEY